MHMRAFKHRLELEKTLGIFLKSAAGGRLGEPIRLCFCACRKSDLLSDPYTIQITRIIVLL